MGRRRDYEGKRRDKVRERRVTGKWMYGRHNIESGPTPLAMGLWEVTY
jgi:hypothetical protein